MSSGNRRTMRPSQHTHIPVNRRFIFIHHFKRNHDRLWLFRISRRKMQPSFISEQRLVLYFSNFQELSHFATCQSGLCTPNDKAVYWTAAPAAMLELIRPSGRVHGTAPENHCVLV